MHARNLARQDILRAVTPAVAAGGSDHKSQIDAPKWWLVSRSLTPAVQRVDTVYNLTVADFHTYFVGDAGVLVHNASPCASVVEHASQRAARRAALREAGIPAGTSPARAVPSNPGSQAPTGTRGTRAEWNPSSDANVGVHHDPYGHLFPDGSTIKPHYGVDVPGKSTVHHTYPTTHNPSLNR